MELPTALKMDKHSINISKVRDVELFGDFFFFFLLPDLKSAQETLSNVKTLKPYPTLVHPF